MCNAWPTSALFHINFDANRIASGESEAPWHSILRTGYGFIQYMDEWVHRAKSKQQSRKGIPSVSPMSFGCERMRSPTYYCIISKRLGETFRCCLPIFLRGWERNFPAAWAEWLLLVAYRTWTRTVLTYWIEELQPRLIRVLKKKYGSASSTHSRILEIRPR